MAKQSLIQKVAVGVGICATLAGCTSIGRNYNIVDHIRGHERNKVTDEDAPYQFELISLYGTPYCVQKDEKSKTGFSLVKYSTTGLLETINEGKRNVTLESNDVYWARPWAPNNGGQNDRVRLKTDDSPYAVKATRRTAGDITKGVEGIGVVKVDMPDYDIKTLRVNGKEFYWPFRKEPGKTKLNFLTIDRNGHLREIGPNGQITIIQPNGIYEWVAKSIIEEAEKKAAEKAAKTDNLKTGSIEEKAKKSKVPSTK